MAAGRTLVTGARWGVLGTESIVLKLCAGRPTPERVRVAVIPRGGGDYGPLGAHRASGAPFVVAPSSMAPTTALARVAVAILSAMLAFKPLGRFMVRRLASVHPTPNGAKREGSFAHARVQWSDGTARERWLRAADGMLFTFAVAAEVAARLAEGQGRPGAYTPGALVGPELAEKAGGHFLLEPLPQQG